MGLVHQHLNIYRARVASMSKNFIKQADDWAQWKTAIYSELENGDVYTDSSRQGVSYLYFTQDDLNAITPKIDNIAIDPSLYELVPTASNEDGKYLASPLLLKALLALMKMVPSLSLLRITL